MSAAIGAFALALAATAPAQGEADERPEVAVSAGLEAGSLRDEEGRWLFGAPGSFTLDLYGNILARKETKEIFDENGEPVGDVARFRQLDLVFGAPLAAGVDVLVAASAQSTLANDEFELEFDQAWVRFERLPLLGDIPGDSSFRVGQFRTRFGRLNRERVYDLPQPVRPRALTTFLGEGGYAQAGLSGDIGVPVGDAGTVRFIAEYMDSGSPPITDRDGAFAGGSNLRVAWESDASVEHGAEVGASLLHSRREDRDPRRVTLLGLDALYRWRPEPDRPARLWLGGEWIQAEIDDTSGGTAEPNTWYAWGQLRLADQWSAGGHLDLSEELEDASLRTRTIGLDLTHLVSDDVRISLAVERSQSDVDQLDDVTRVFVELNFAFGTGPQRPFWLR